MPEHELIPGLFRSEFRKIVSVLCKYLGPEHINTAEDITSETFLSALETWPYKGVPDNPVAWLYTVSKNKTFNFIRREKLFSDKVMPQLQTDGQVISPEAIDLSDKGINDSQLQMLFAVMHPAVSIESQLCLALRILCGFGIGEIADSLLTTRANVNKKLTRAREKLRKSNIKIEMPGDAEIEKRLHAVLTTIYLLFNEGYYSESSDSIIREDLCLEAMRLAYLLAENDKTNRPEVNALIAMMCFHASRFRARKNNNGMLILYDQQDESLWNNELVARGAYFLNKAAAGETITKFHLEANIAYWHTVKADTRGKWENILDLYNRLLIIEYSPVAALNRTYALSKTRGKKQAIDEAEKLGLVNNRYYFMLLGELYSGIDKSKAQRNLEKALALAKTSAEIQLINEKLRSVNTQPAQLSH